MNNVFEIISRFQASVRRKHVSPQKKSSPQSYTLKLLNLNKSQHNNVKMRCMHTLLCLGYDELTNFITYIFSKVSNLHLLEKSVYEIFDLTRDP